MKSAYKTELADAAGVSRTTFWRWMNENRCQLARLGVKRNSKLLSPKAVEWICQQYGIDWPAAA